MKSRTLDLSSLPSPALNLISAKLSLKDGLSLFAATSRLFKTKSTGPSQYWDALKEKLESCLPKSIHCVPGRLIVLTRGNQLLACGMNAYGELGMGHKDRTVTLKPINLKLLDGERVKKIELGDEFSIVLTSKRRIFVWGNNEHGQLGLGDTMLRKLPTRLKLNLEDGEVVSKIRAGSSFAAALTSRGRVFVWGFNFNNLLGLGNEDSQLTPQLRTLALSAGETIRDISMGGLHIELATSEGRRIITGYFDALEENGEAADDISEEGDFADPEFSEGESPRYTWVAAGRRVFLTNIGRIIVQGMNFNGELALGHREEQPNPVEIPYTAGIRSSIERIKQVERETRDMGSSQEGAVMTSKRRRTTS